MDMGPGVTKCPPEYLRIFKVAQPLLDEGPGRVSCSSESASSVQGGSISKSSCDWATSVEGAASERAPTVVGSSLLLSLSSGTSV